MRPGFIYEGGVFSLIVCTMWANQHAVRDTVGGVNQDLPASTTQQWDPHKRGLIRLTNLGMTSARMNITFAPSGQSQKPEDNSAVYEQGVPRGLERGPGGDDPAPLLDLHRIRLFPQHLRANV